MRQYSTSNAVYPFSETCQFQVGEQLRVLLIEGLNEAEQQFLCASLNCHILSYMEAQNGLFMTLQSLFDHSFGSVG